jgi:Iap family predicted aminopeptidase
MKFNSKKTTEEILAQIEIDKINAKSTMLKAQPKK